jgi:hypothetical protein
VRLCYSPCHQLPAPMLNVHRPQYHAPHDSWPTPTRHWAIEAVDWIPTIVIDPVTAYHHDPLPCIYLRHVMYDFCFLPAFLYS